MRAEAALGYLRARPYTWIPVSSDETVDALRELRRDGHDVRTRTMNGVREASYTPPPAPRQQTLTSTAMDVFGDDVGGVSVIPPCPHPEYARQARTDAPGTVCMECGETFTTVGATTPGAAGRRNPMIARNVDGGVTYEVSAQTCPQCGEEYLVRDEHVQRSPRHVQWAKGELTGPEVPVPMQQPTFKFPLDTPRSRIEFGMVITCPRCHGNRLRERNGRGRLSGTRLPAEDFTRDPSKRDERCMRCNGWGIVPNSGPVVADSHLMREGPRGHG